MKTKIWFMLNGAEDFIIVDGQHRAEVCAAMVPDGAEYLDHESRPAVSDPQFDL